MDSVRSSGAQLRRTLCGFTGESYLFKANYRSRHRVNGAGRQGNPLPPTLHSCAVAVGICLLRFLFVGCLPRHRPCSQMCGGPVVGDRFVIADRFGGLRATYKNAGLFGITAGYFNLFFLFMRVVFCDRALTRDSIEWHAKR